MRRLLLLLACSLLLSASASAAAPTRPVLVLHPGHGQGDRYSADVLPAARAQLDGMPVDLQAVAVGGVLGPELAAQLAEQVDAWTVAWLAEDTDSVFLLSPSLGSEVRSRPLDPGVTSWVVKSEAVAAILRSELEAVVSQAVEVQARRAQARRTLLALRVGYTPVPVSTEGPVLHGVDLGVGFRFGRHLGFELGASITSPIPLGIEDGKGEMLRVPLRFSVTGSLPVGRFEPSLALGLALEVLQVTGLSFEPADAAALVPLVTPGLSANIQARYRVLPWLAPFVLVGVDVLVRDQVVVRDGVTLVHRDRAVLQAAVGVSFLVPVGAI